jgi:hypothetical protein
MISCVVNSKQRQTLRAVFERPTRADLRWTEIVSLLKALGAEVEGGDGSRVAVALRGRRAVFHRPHPSPHASKGLVEAVRTFLASVEVKR